MSITEGHMLGLLRRRHPIRPREFPRWIYAEQVENQWEVPVRRIDAIALDRREVPLRERPQDSQGNRVLPPTPIHGFEVKVSRSDWLSELRTDGQKSALWRSYCTHWWIVVPDAGIITPRELPAGWGLLVGAKALRAHTQAVRSEPQKPLPYRLHNLIAAAALKTQARYTQEEGINGR